MNEEHPLETVSKISQFNDLQEFMQDPDLDRVLDVAIKCIAKPEVNAQKVPLLIVELQAISLTFSLKAAEYATIKKDRAGTDNNHKKNIYYSARDAIDRLVDALKYLARM